MSDCCKINCMWGHEHCLGRVNPTVCGRPEFKDVIGDHGLRFGDVHKSPVHHVPTTAIEPRHDRMLVVARFNEDVSWLVHVPFPVIVYNKGSSLEHLPPNVTQVMRPNHGREAETIAHHIASHYDRLAPLTFFSQGNPFDHSPDFLDRLGADWHEPTSLTVQYLPDVPSSRIKCRDLVEEVEGFEVRYGDALAQDHEHLSFQWFDPAIWDYLFDGPMPSPFYFGYGAMWAVPRAFIHLRPLMFWRWLHGEITSGVDSKSKTVPPTNPWMLEATWRYLWRGDLYPHKPFPVKTGTIVRTAQPKGCGCGNSPVVTKEYYERLRREKIERSRSHRS